MEALEVYLDCHLNHKSDMTSLTHQGTVNVHGSSTGSHPLNKLRNMKASQRKGRIQDSSGTSSMAHMNLTIQRLSATQEEDAQPS